MNGVSGPGRVFGIAGGIGLFLGVAFGAFAAHSMRNVITADMLEVFETGVRYQVYHSLALLFVSLLAERNSLFRHAGEFYIAGIILFSFSLYILALTGISSFGFLTPVGGVSFLAGHALLVGGFIKSR